MKKRRSQLLLLLSLGTLIAACGVSSLNRIKKDKVVLVGTVPFNAPLLYQKGEELLGPEVELAKRIAEKLSKRIMEPGSPIKIDLEWIIRRRQRNLVPALENREVDLVVSVFGTTEERKQRVLFSEPYYTSELALIINPAHRELRPDLLKGAKIGAREGTAVEEVVKSKFPNSSTVGFQTLDDAIFALRRAEVDAVIDDRRMAAYTLDTLPGAGLLEIIPGTVGAFDCAVAVRKADQPLLEIVNEVITEIKAEDQYAQWVNEYDEGRLAKVERRSSPREVVVRVSKDPRNPFDIYLMANLRFVFKNSQSGESYSTSQIRFQGQVGVSSARVPLGTYSLSLPRFNFNAGTVSIESSDSDQIDITIRLRADNAIEIQKR